MEEVQNRPGSQLSFFQVLESASKFSLLFVGLSYVFGFIIVNSYLSSIGVISTSILKAKYIAAGMGFLLILLLSGLMFYPMILLIFKLEAPFRKEIPFYAIGLFLGYFIQFLFGFIAPGSVKSFSLFKLSPFEQALAFIMIGIIVFFCVAYCSEKLSKMGDWGQTCTID
jgi:uncharacterized protein YacL